MEHAATTSYLLMFVSLATCYFAIVGSQRGRVVLVGFTQNSDHFIVVHALVSKQSPVSAVKSWVTNPFAVMVPHRRAGSRQT